MTGIMTASRLDTGFVIAGRIVSIAFGAGEEVPATVRARRCWCCQELTHVTRDDNRCRNEFCPSNEIHGDNSGGP